MAEPALIAAGAAGALTAAGTAGTAATAGAAGAGTAAGVAGTAATAGAAGAGTAAGVAGTAATAGTAAGVAGAAATAGAAGGGAAGTAATGLTGAAAAAGAVGAVHVLTPLELFQQADIIVKVVMVLLILASAWGWGLIAAKSYRLTILNRRANRLLNSLRAGLSTSALSEAFLLVRGDDPLRIVYQAMVDENARSSDLRHSTAQQESLLERIHRVAQLASSNSLDKLRSGLQTLATIGAISPFVGLFGTVWGIMNSFQGIAASNNTSLAVVAPGIAESLFATALGLVAAIPAVIFYNRIAGNIGLYGKHLSTFIGVYEVELSRQLSRGETHGRRAA
jgi:biopolymer transport protein TolQ